MAAGGAFAGALAALRGAAGGGCGGGSGGGGVGGGGGEAVAAEAVAAAAAEAAGALRSGGGVLGELVAALEEDLGGEGGAAERARAVEFLACVAEQAAEGLGAAELQHLAVFLAARVASDWLTMRPGLRACLCLLRCEGPSGAPRLPSEAACAVAMAVCRDADVPAQPQAVRTLAFQCLHVFFDQHASGGALEGREEELAEGTILALEGEKDPRCLLGGLAAVQALARSLGGSAPGRTALARVSDEAVDILSCYFPVVFTPPPGGAPAGLTREAIVEALEGALSCCLEFAPYALDLAAQKSSSPNHRTQQECLHLLLHLLKKFGPAAALAPVPATSGEGGETGGSGDGHEAASRLWVVLGPLFGAVAAAGIGEEERRERRLVAAAAADVLGLFLHYCSGVGEWAPEPALGAALEKEAWGDAHVEASLHFLRSGNDGSDAAPEVTASTLLSVEAAGFILRGAGSGHADTCERVLRTVLPLCCVGDPYPPPPRGMGGALAGDADAPSGATARQIEAARLGTASEVLQGLRALCRRGDSEGAGRASTSRPLHLARSQTAALLSRTTAMSALPGGPEMAAPLLCVLATFPEDCQALGEAQLRSVLAALGQLWARGVCGGQARDRESVAKHLAEACAAHGPGAVHASALSPVLRSCFPSNTEAPSVSLLFAAADLLRDSSPSDGKGHSESMLGLAPYLLKEFLDEVLAAKPPGCSEEKHTWFLMEALKILRDRVVPACCAISGAGARALAGAALEEAALKMLESAAAAPGGRGLFPLEEGGGAGLCVLFADTVAALVRGLPEGSQAKWAAQAEAQVTRHRESGVDAPGALLTRAAGLMGVSKGVPLSKPTEVVRTLLIGALACRSAAVERTLAEVLGGVVAKLPTQDDLASAAELVLSYPRPAVSEDDGTSHGGGLMCLAWVFRALVARSHPVAPDVLRVLVDACHGRGALSAARALGAVLDDAAAGRSALNHWPRRFLHSQWVFSTSLPLVSARLGEAGGGEAAWGLVRAQAWLIVSVPPSVAQQALGASLPADLASAFQALRAPGGPGDADTALLNSLLRYVGAVLGAEQSQLSKGLLEHSDSIAGHLTDLSDFGAGWVGAEATGAAEVREMALLALGVLVEVAPKAALFPKLHTVRRRLEQARDDPRRAVRLAAVKALRAWSSALS